MPTTEYATSFSRATEGGYKTRDTAKSSALSSATNSLSSLTIDADIDALENLKEMANAQIKTLKMSGRSNNGESY